jgi:hypothetical protein
MRNYFNKFDKLKITRVKVMFGRVNVKEKLIVSKSVTEKVLVAVMIKNNCVRNVVIM